MPPTRLLINDIDLAAYGLWANLPLGWADAPGITDRITRMPGYAGGILLGSDAEVATREISIEAMMSAPAGDLRAQWDAVKHILDSPILEIRFAEWPDRFGLGRFRAAQFRSLPGLSPDYGTEITLRFLLPNPYLHARQVDVYTALDGSRVAPTLGTAPSPVDLYLIGTGIAQPTITYVTAQGIPAGTIFFDLTDSSGAAVVLATSDWIEVDGTTLDAVWHKASGALDENAMPYLNTASRLFVADPADGDETGYPQLYPVNCNLVANIRRAWR